VTAAIAAEDLAVDHALADISRSFRLVLDVTPTNADEARERFLDGRDDEPAFEYRPLEDDPDVLRAELDAVDVEQVADPTVAHLVQAKRRELGLQIEMLAARGSPNFRALSTELYGAVTPSLLASAEGLLEVLEPARSIRAATTDRSCIDAEALARLAEVELDHYRGTAADIAAHVEIRADSTGVMVTDGELLIASGTRVTSARVQPLLQHEIGTHVLTFVNGSHQPLRLLAAGLAGYEETQEGLALLAEHLCGGLTVSRLRQIAVRVVAVHRMLDGATFREVHDGARELGFSEVGAFNIAMRVARGGGLAKDLVYLRGLVDLLDHVNAGHSLDVLWLGKMSLADAPLIEDLWQRGALADSLLRPRYLAVPEATARLAALRRADSILDLVEV
jgi:uncharacterized protein (TIGR02421 family)